MLTIQEDILRKANMSENDFLQEMAIFLYQKQKLSFGLAAQFANLNYANFQFLLGENQVAVHYNTDDLNDDLETIKKLRNGCCK
jgi:predicted HTH domain antitoxin